MMKKAIVSFLLLIISVWSFSVTILAEEKQYREIDILKKGSVDTYYITNDKKIRVLDESKKICHVYQYHAGKFYRSKLQMLHRNQFAIMGNSEESDGPTGFYLYKKS